mmetsp:Transcript_6085/g.13160  ORF Transcript_6085/g.13160 Transcript_6085/m.13160 type:complete len:251 (-) Transcript_6085:32-784(-)
MFVAVVVFFGIGETVNTATTIPTVPFLLHWMRTVPQRSAHPSIRKSACHFFLVGWAAGFVLDQGTRRRQRPTQDGVGTRVAGTDRVVSIPKEAAVVIVVRLGKIVLVLVLGVNIDIDTIVVVVVVTVDTNAAAVLVPWLPVWKIVAFAPVVHHHHRGWARSRVCAHGTLNGTGLRVGRSGGHGTTGSNRRCRCRAGRCQRVLCCVCARWLLGPRLRLQRMPVHACVGGIVLVPRKALLDANGNVRILVVL